MKDNRADEVGAGEEADRVGGDGSQEDGSGAVSLHVQVPSTALPSSPRMPRRPAESARYARPSCVATLTSRHED